VLERASRGAARTSTGARGHAGASTRPALRGLRAAAATGVCTIAVVVGFALPVALLLRLIALEPALAVDPRFGQWIWNSLRVAALAALLAVAAAMLAAYAVRLDRGRLTRASARVLTLGYAVPGTVLAIGVLLPLGGIDAWLADLARRGGDPRPGLLLTGTVVALIYAYVVRYFAVAWNGIEPGLARITPAMDAASRSLGSGAGATFARVHAPLLARSTAAALLLVFVDVMKELPATLVLRPFNFETLATQTFQLTRDERLTEAALPSLAMVVVGLVPIVMLARAARRTVASRRGTAAPATTIASA
jgi:iron(III) transport system permease protein